MCVLCGLETSLCPRTVLCKRVAAHVMCAREAQVRERGRPRQPCPTSTGCQGARVAVQASARAQSITPRSCCAFHAAALERCAKDERAGCSQACPVRRQAHPRCSRSRCGICPAPIRWRASPWRRRRAPTWEPSWSTPGLSRVCSPNGPATSGPGHGCGATAPPLPQRPP